MSASKLHKYLFGLWTIQGVTAFCWIFLIPTDAENGSLLGFTPARLVLLGIAFILTGLSLVLFYHDRLPLYSQIEKFRYYERLGDVSLIFSTFLLVAAPTVILTLRSFTDGPQYIAYAERLSPLAFWFILSAFELILYIVYLRRETGIRLLKRLISTSRTFLFVFSIIFVITLGVAFTKIGITPDYNMGAPAIPLFEWQVALIVLMLIGYAFFLRQKFVILDRWVIPFVYFLTVAIWLSQPINAAYTATPPRAPNFEIYPFSDPQIYAQYAQAAIVGNGFLYPDVPSRALYVAFLTWAHLLGNQNYELVVVLQTLLLAWFPVSLYLIGKELGGRAVGFGLAALPFFRDVNSNIAVPFASNVTYSKLLLSEIPLALFLGFFIWVVIRWLKYDQHSRWMPLLAGGILGGAALIRTQSVALVAVIALIAFLVIKNKKEWFKGVLILGIALAFTLLPWLGRNYIATGGLVVDNPISQMMTMARRWNGSWGNEMIPRLADETDAQYSSRMTQVAIDAFKRDPQFVLRTAANHFINSEIASLMILPVRNEIRSPSELLVPQHAFWSTTITSRQLPLFAFYLFLFGMGLSVAISRFSWIGVIPFTLGIAYNAWTALFFSSGERFIVPLDWTVYLYQLLGLITLGSVLLAFTAKGYESASFWTRELLTPTPAVLPAAAVSPQRQLYLAAGIVMLLAVFTPATEFIFPTRYPPLLAEELKQQAGFSAEQGEIIIYGRATYPRYYFSGEGEPETEKLGYRESEQARLVFNVAGSTNALVVFELPDSPSFFPHASDVYMVGTWSEEGYFSPRAALVMKNGQSAVYELP